VYPRKVLGLNDANVKDVSCGGAHTAAVTEDGRLFTWGLNDRGQLGRSPEGSQCEVPGEVRGIEERVVSVAAGHYHTLCVTESGSVWAFGCNRKGQLGVKSNEAAVYAPRQLSSFGSVKIARVDGGAEHSLACTLDGEMYSWGCAGSGRLGHGDVAWWKFKTNSQEHAPRLVQKMRGVKITGVSAGHMHSACVDQDGLLYTFGYGRFFQLGLDSDRDHSVPTLVHKAHAVQSVSCGGNHSVAHNFNGQVLVWGANDNGVLGLGLEDKGMPEPRVLERVDAVQVASGWKHSAAITSKGTVLTWGWGGSMGSAVGEGGCGGGQLGHGDINDRWKPMQVKDFITGAGMRAVQIACGFNHTAAIIEIGAK